MTKCKICSVELTTFGHNKLKDCCRRCYNDIYYIKNWERLIEEKRKIGTRKRSFSYYKNYLKNNPDQKRLLGIRQQTYHKYGKAKECVFCKSKNKVQHHHFVPYEVDNFIDICSLCHKKYFHRKHNKQKLKEMKK